MKINPELYFVLCDGRTIKSLEELAIILKTIDKKIYEYHVNDQKNDFSNWIEYVFNTKSLADTIRKNSYGQRNQTITAIKENIKTIKTNILVFNAGSSSLKFQLIEINSKQVIFKGKIDAINSERCNMNTTYDDKTSNYPVKITTHEQAVALVIQTMLENNIHMNEIEAIGHRVVDGEEFYDKPVCVDEEVLKTLEHLNSVAPLHNPPSIACIRACKFNIPNIAVFDTAFHATISKEKYMYAIPYEYYEKFKIRKYGFHGTSHKYVTKIIQEYYKKNSRKNKNKFIICHLGNGSSITAVKDGKSFNTTMGFTPLDGLPMGTRCGSIDPGVILHLEKNLNIGVDALHTMLNKESGFKGLCGYTDMRDIRKNIQEEKCLLAYDVLADRVIQDIGAYIAEMNGVDAIIFTAGIGENASYLRKKVLDNLSFHGVKINEQKNDANEFIISAKNSKIDCFVVQTNEELQIAIEVGEIIKDN